MNAWELGTQRRRRRQCRVVPFLFEAYFCIALLPKTPVGRQPNAKMIIKDMDVTTAESQTSVSNKEVEVEAETADWAPEEERRLVRKLVLHEPCAPYPMMQRACADQACQGSTGLFCLLWSLPSSPSSLTEAICKLETAQLIVSRNNNQQWTC